MQWHIGADGRQESLAYRENKRDYLNPPDPPEVMRVYRGDRMFPATSAFSYDSVLQIGFNSADVTLIRTNSVRYWMDISVDFMSKAPFGLRSGR